ncbi:MAG: dihydrodipicolinate synthase family protein [Thermodesulfobacteriota bacterium]
MREIKNNIIIYPPKGLIIALITPFNERGEIDWPSWQNLLHHTLPFADGLFIGEGMIGEGIYLSNKLRLELAQGAIEAIKGQKPLFIGLTAPTAEETMANFAEIGQKYNSLAEKGLLYLVDTPLWYHSNRRLPQFYETLLERSSCPIILTNNPVLISLSQKSWKRKNIRTNILKRLAAHPAITGLINLSDLKRAINYQRAVRPRRDFRIYDGDEKNFLAQPSAAGVVSAGANLFPGAWHEVVWASLNPSENPAQNFGLWEKSEKLKKFYQIYHGTPAQSLKFALYQQGIIKHPRTLGKDPAQALLGSKELRDFLQENLSGLVS